jgi:hypothetical protein
MSHHCFVREAPSQHKQTQWMPPLLPAHLATLQIENDFKLYNHADHSSIHRRIPFYASSTNGSRMTTLSATEPQSSTPDRLAVNDTFLPAIVSLTISRALIASVGTMKIGICVSGYLYFLRSKGAVRPWQGTNRVSRRKSLL